MGSTKFETQTIVEIRQQTSIVSLRREPETTPLSEIEREAIRQALEMNNNVQRNAATTLGLSPRTINYKMQTLGILRPLDQRRKEIKQTQIEP